MLHTMQSPPPTVFLTSHMVFIKLWEVEEPCDGAVEDLVVICLPLRYRNRWNSQYYIDWGAMSTPSNVCLFLDCVMKRLGGRCFHMVLIIITHVFTISLGIVLSECTYSESWWGHGYAPARLLVHGPGQSWADGECTLGLQWGHGHARFCVQHGTKSMAMGSLSFFFLLAAKISLCDM